MAVQDQLRIDVRRAGDRVILTLHGVLDLATAALLEKQSEGVDLDATSVVVLDLRALEFIDSTGLRTILAAQERSRGRGGEFAVTRGSPQVQRLLSITRADEHLRIIDSPDETFV